jgi:hypothetical protein
MSNDFDFLHGDWDVANRRLVKRLVGSDEWDEFPATSTARGFFDGAGSFDEITFPTKGWSGATFRMRSPETGDWSIYWVNSRTAELQPPVVGRFTDGVGTFYGDDVDDGTPVRVRFIWSRITPTSARWEQAFSTDAERTWETNWIMDHNRLS